MSDPDGIEAESTLVTGASADGRSGRVLRVGDIVGGNYKIISYIGRGGMGIVYKARHLAIGRDVALKTLAPERVDQQNWQRFESEGKAIGRLDHQNIVKVYDMGAEGPDCLYYVMDLLQGVSLADYIVQKNVLDWPEAMEIFEQLCAGLGYAHGRGLVHRDIKPSNIILCPAAGENVPLVKIIDFGLVKLLGEADRLQQSQTKAGQVCGSPLYMSPEQCMGGTIDARSDIYSLGCTLFECLTGTPPFLGKDGLATASMHRDKRPPLLREERPDKKYPDNLEELVGHMLEKLPSQRQQSIAQVAQEIARVKAGKSISRAPVFSEKPLYDTDPEAEREHVQTGQKNSAPFKWLAVIGTFALIAGLGLAGFYFNARRADEKVAKILTPDDARHQLLTSQKESPEIKKVREIFADCPPISHGLVDRSGVQKRVFEFPSVSLGLVCWGRNGQYKSSARGSVEVPATDPVTLELRLPESRYTRMFPQILAKIGPADIAALSLIEEDSPVDEYVAIYEVPPSFIEAISKWTALRRLEIHNCRMGKESVLALNQLSSIKRLNLRDSNMDAKNLAQVRWLKQLQALDIRAIENVDAAVVAMAGAPNLVDFNLDRTAPSRAALIKLAACPRLTILSLSESEIDDDKLDAVCQIQTLKSLNLKRCMVTSAGLSKLGRLKMLKQVVLDCMGLDSASVDKLRREMPGCTIYAKEMVSKFKI